MGLPAGGQRTGQLGEESEEHPKDAALTRFPPTDGGEQMGRAKKQAEKEDRTHARPLSDANKNRRRYPNAMLWAEEAKSLRRVNS